MGEIDIFTLPYILMRDAHEHLQSSSTFHESFTHLQLLPSPTRMGGEDLYIFIPPTC